MRQFVLYYQSQGPTPHVQDPQVLCVGSEERCEAVKRAFLSDPFFRLVQMRDGQSGVLRVVPRCGKNRSVVCREVPFQRSVAALGAVSAI